MNINLVIPYEYALYTVAYLAVGLLAALVMQTRCAATDRMGGWQCLAVTVLWLPIACFGLLALMLSAG